MRRNGEKGSFTIEATLTVPLFMFAFLAIVSLSLVAKVESTTQYAIDQVAKEISQYYYIAEKIGIANTNSDSVEEIDGAVQSVFDFADTTNTVAKEYSNASIQDLDSAIQTFSGVEDDVNDVTAAAENLYSSFKPIFEDPKGIVSTLATLMAKEVGNEVMTKIIAQPLCKVLVPKYITSNGDPNETLLNMGIVNGLDGLDFRMSSFLTDQRSINVVLVYQIKVNGFGVFDDILVVKQTASTAAWVKGTSLKEANQVASKWGENDTKRNQSYVDTIQNEQPHQAVKEGTGIDLYDQDSNTFTAVKAINVLSIQYSDYQKVAAKASDPENYFLKKDVIKGAVKNYANSLKKDIDKIDQNIILKDGTTCQTAYEKVKHRSAELILVVPEEAKSKGSNLDILNEIAAEIEAETGVRVSITYREKALD